MAKREHGLVSGSCHFVDYTNHRTHLGYEAFQIRTIALTDDLYPPVAQRVNDAGHVVSARPADFQDCVTRGCVVKEQRDTCSFRSRHHLLLGAPHSNG